MREPSQEYLHECFEYEDGVLKWKQRPRYHFKTDAAWKRFNNMYFGKIAAKKPKLCKSDNSYRCYIKIMGKSYFRSRIVYVMFYGRIPSNMDIDHKSAVTLDDRIENLRCVTHQENSYNQKKRTDNTTGCNGVYYEKTNNKWIALHFGEQKSHYLYRGDDFFEAVCARKSWESKNTMITERHGK